MKNIYFVFLVLLLSACGTKIDGTYSNSMANISYTFNPDKTAQITVVGITAPVFMAYEVSGNKLVIQGNERGNTQGTILDDGTLVINGLKFTKDKTSAPAPVAAPVAAPPAAPAPSPVAEPKAPPAIAQATVQPQMPQQATWAPSFDCAKASTVAEKTICADPLLGKFDGALSENYKYMLASDIGDGARNDLKATQKKWLAERNKCTDSQCLATSYRKRIDEVCEYPVVSGVHPVCTASNDIK